MKGRNVRMENIVIIGIIAIIVLVAARSALKHFKGEGGCCGGGTYKARKKKLDKVIAKKTFKVGEMSCQHCVNRVMEAVHSIEGASASVNLNKGIVTVEMDRAIADEEIIAVIEKAGYPVSR